MADATVPHDTTTALTALLPATTLTDATNAAAAVFDRALKDYSPNRVFVEEAVAVAAGIVIAALTGPPDFAVDKARALNKPMTARLRECATYADESTSVWPAEAQQLVELIDMLTAGPDPDGPAPLAARHDQLTRALKAIIVTAGPGGPDPETTLQTIRDHAVNVLAEDLP